MSGATAAHPATNSGGTSSTITMPVKVALRAIRKAVVMARKRVIAAVTTAMLRVMRAAANPAMVVNNFSNQLARKFI
ncbi:hypothetical protein D3C85_1520000 [compost metagenome]